MWQITKLGNLYWVVKGNQTVLQRLTLVYNGVGICSNMLEEHVSVSVME